MVIGSTEDRRNYSPQQWLKQVERSHHEIPRVVRYAPTIVGVWENYKVYLERGKNLAAWHRAVPSFFTFDDHEILDDTYGGGSAGRRDRRTVFRDIGVQAWYDYLGWSNPVEHKQEIYFGQAKLESGSDILVDEQADFRRLDLGQAANLHIHWGGPNAGAEEEHFDEMGGDPNAGVYDVVEVLNPRRLRIPLPLEPMERLPIQSVDFLTSGSASATATFSSWTRAPTGRCTISNSPTSRACRC